MDWAKDVTRQLLGIIHAAHSIHSQRRFAADPHHVALHGMHEQQAQQYGTSGNQKEQSQHSSKQLTLAQACSTSAAVQPELLPTCCCCAPQANTATLFFQGGIVYTRFTMMVDTWIGFSYDTLVHV